MNFETRCSDDAGHLRDNEARLSAAFREFAAEQAEAGVDVTAPWAAAARDAWRRYKVEHDLRSSVVLMDMGHPIPPRCGICGAPVVTVEIATEGLHPQPLDRPERG